MGFKRVVPMNLKRHGFYAVDEFLNDKHRFFKEKKRTKCAK